MAESGTRRRLQIAGFVAACSLVLLAMVGWLQLGRSESPGSLVIETNVGESREVALSDGSQVSVSGRTLLWVTFGPNSRSVKLERGEAFFHVAKDSRRPFTVRSNNTAVTAVGTAFDVREAAGRVVIGVAEGVVKVETATAPPETGISAPPIIRLASVVAGQQLTVEQTGSVKSAQRIDPHTVADWRDGRLWYLDEPLESVVSDLNRFAPRNIRIADPAVGRLRVTGTVLAGSEDSWLRSLETSLPVVIVRDTDGAVVIEARK